jgi:hypothetical protein
VNRYRHRIGLAKNKIRKSGKFFGVQISAIFAPRFTTQSPQFHEQITIQKHANFQNPPQKHPQNSQNSQPSLPEFFCQIRTQKTSPPPKSKIKPI